MERESEIKRHIREHNIFERILFFLHIFIDLWFTEQRIQLTLKLILE
jgi:hypothetical protein